MHHTDTVRIATNPRKWRRPAPCPACRKSQPLILTLGTIYKLRTRKPVNTIYGCICPNCRHKCILHVDGTSLCMALAGCGSASEPSTPARAVRSIESQCSQDEDGGFRECVITLTDTRQVDCVVYSGYRRGGLSCDWDHVSGADKDPER